MDDRDVERDVEAYRRGGLRAAEGRGRGVVRGANRRRVEEVEGGGAFDPYLRTSKSPTLTGMSRFAHGLGMTLIELGEHIARHERGPWALVERAAGAILAREGRLLESLAKARTRAHTKPPAGIGIEALNEERFSDPKAALKSSFAALRAAGGRPEIARVLAVHASNLRECGQLDDAVLALWVAMALAEAAEMGERERLALLAWLYLAAAGVMRAKGEREPAGQLIDEAEAFACRARSRRGRTIALLDRAGLLVDSYGDHQGAIAEATAALALVRPSSFRLVCAAYQLRALAHHMAGDLDRANHDIEAAAARVPAGASMLRGRVRWVQGEMAFERGELTLAETFLGEASRLIVEPASDRLLIAPRTGARFVFSLAPLPASRSARIRP